MLENYINVIQSFIILLKYIAQADGIISEDEIEYFEEFLTKIKGEDVEIGNLFNDIKISSLVKVEDVVSCLEKIAFNEKILSLINAIGIACADKIDERELVRIKEIIEHFKIPSNYVQLISGVTKAGELVDSKKDENIKNNILYISNKPEEADILVKRENFLADFFLLNDNIYFYGITTNGKIVKADGTVLFDKIVTEIKKEDSIVLDKNVITYDEIKRRLKRKREKFKNIFLLLAEENLAGKKFFIVNSNNSNINIDNIYAEIEIQGNICSITQKSRDIFILIDEKIVEQGKRIYFGIEDPIIIKESKDKLDYLRFDILKILNKESISSTFYIEDKELVIKRISNNDKSAEIFLENHNTENEKQFIDLEIKIDKNSALLEIKRSYLPIFLNGGRVENNIVKLPKKAKISIARELINCDFDKGTISKDFVRIERVDVKNVTYKYKGRDIALDDISFSNNYGDLVCIMGPSGCGKSTLMKLMLGYLDGFTGSIEFNGLSFHKYFNVLKEFVGYVPQDDLLFENLTVYENLFYAGKLKNPHISDEALNKKINELLIELGLSEKRELPVGNELKRTLSGGERRRLNIGIELLSDVDLLFLDEPTSGLSSYDSKKIIDLLYNYAQKGKIIYVVIHQPSSELYYKFNKLILLDYGGKLAYFGDTSVAIDYFSSRSIRIDDASSCPVCKKGSPDLILNVLQEVRRDLNGNVIYTKVKNSKIPLRVKTPDTWKKIFESYRNQNQLSYVQKDNNNNSNIDSIVNENKGFTDKVRERLTRLKILFLRNFKDKLRDKVNIFMTFLVPILLVIILAFLMRSKSLPEKIDKDNFNNNIITKLTDKEKENVFKIYDEKDNYYRIKNEIAEEDKKSVMNIFKSKGFTEYLFKNNESFEKFLFLTVIIFIFLGITSSISEILKDRAKIQRERLINIKTEDYLLTKVITIFIFAFIQVLLYIILSFLILEIPFAIPEFGYFGMRLLFNFFIISFLTVAISAMLGFFVSALLKSEKSIFTIIPILIIPQIIFGGLFLNYDDMGGRIIQKDRPVPFYADFIISRWAYEGLLITTYKFNPNNEVWVNVTNKYYKKNLDKIDKIKEVSNYYNENMKLRFNDYAFLTIKNAEKGWRYFEYLNKKYKDKNIFDFFKNLLSNRNVFPATNKIVYHYKISTVYFNTFILLVGTFLLFILTFVFINKDRKVKFKK